MEKELIRVFKKTMRAHYSSALGVSEEIYTQKFISILRNEIKVAPTLNVKKGNLATYIKLSVLALSMARQLTEYELSELEIGERIYKTADDYFKLSPFIRWIKKTLFFTNFNIKQIIKRQKLSNAQETGINGFKIKFIKGRSKNNFGVDYLRCGICDYYKNRNIFEYVKYCCLVDYAIMKNMGISFSRTTTLGNGGEKCDFRFAKDGPITEGWPPVNLEEFQRLKR